MRKLNGQFQRTISTWSWSPPPIPRTWPSRSTIWRASTSHRAASRRPEPLNKRAIAIQERVGGPNHPSVALALHNLARLYQAQRRDADAILLQNARSPFRKRHSGPDHPTLATSLGSLGETFHRQHPEAEALARRSLAIREKALGPNHAAVGTALNNLALILSSQNRFAETEPLYKRSMQIAETALGRSHPEVSTAAFGLANQYRLQGRHGDAAPLYCCVLAIREATMGPDHPLGVGEVANHLGGLHLVVVSGSRASSCSNAGRASSSADRAGTARGAGGAS